jgi:hypothetical protein
MSTTAAAAPVVMSLHVMTFWPLIYVGMLVVVLVVLTLLDWQSIKMNSFASMFAVSGLFGCVMTAYNVGTKANLTWRGLWPSMLLTVLAAALMLGLARGLAVWHPDVASGQQAPVLG